MYTYSYTVIVTRRNNPSDIQEFNTWDYYAALSFAESFDQKLYIVEFLEW